MSNTRRNNPFINSLAAGKESALYPRLTPWDWNLKGLVRNGHALSFSDLMHRPGIYRPLLSALWVLNVEVIPPSSHRSIEIKRFALRIFERYLVSNCDSSINNLKSLSEITREILIDFRSWMHTNYSSETAGKSYRIIANLLISLQGERSPVRGVLSNDLEIPLRSLRVHGANSSNVNPFTRDEETAIVQACQKAINATLTRLSEGQKLLSKGVDPRIKENPPRDGNPHFMKYGYGWDSIPNILWYIVHVLDGNMPNTHHSEAASEPLLSVLGSPEKPISKSQAFEYLYPKNEDIVPFIILLSLKTGLNAESLLNLNRDCLQGSEGGMTFIQYRKSRGSHEVMRRKFSHRGVNSPVGIIKAVLRMNEMLVTKASTENKNVLWLAYQFRKVKENGSSTKFTNKIDTLSSRYLRCLINGKTIQKSKTCLGFMQKHEIYGHDGNLLVFTFLAARKTDATNEYLRHANLANVSKKKLKHHGPQGMQTTAFHYLTNEATHHVHNQAIRGAQDKVVAEARNILVTSEHPDDKEIASLAYSLAESEDRIESIIQGKQDVFIAACRDYYNRPNGAKNTPCSDPWACFGCSNALWTARILPRLYKFLWFMDEQKLFLDITDWGNKFGLPYRVITKEILPRFQPRVIEWAKSEAKEIPFYIPAHLREV